MDSFQGHKDGLIYTYRSMGYTKLIKGRMDFPGGTVVKDLPANAGDTGQALVREDPTCCGANKPTSHNY